MIGGLVVRITPIDGGYDWEIRIGRSFSVSGFRMDRGEALDTAFAEAKKHFEAEQTTAPVCPCCAGEWFSCRCVGELIPQGGTL